MATYRYQAVHRSTGKKSSDKVHIENVSTFLQDMHRQGYTVTSLKKATAGESKPFWQRSSGQVSKVDKSMALLQLSAFLKAGIPLKNALERMIAEAPSGIAAVMKEAAENLEQGQSFHEAISSQTKFFDAWEIQAVEAAEVSGTLAESLEYIGDQTMKSHEFNSKVKSAMTYPILVLAVTAIVSVVLVVFVIPVFADMLGEENMPKTTKFLLSVSSLIKSYWYAILAALALLVHGLRQFFNKRDMKGTAEHVVLKIPGWGRILQSSYLVRFGKTLSTLLESGVRVLPALEYAGQATGSPLFVKSSVFVRKEVENGARIGDSMRKTGTFPALFCELAAAGESSGTLPEMVMTAASFYESEVNRRLESVSSLIEPVLILIVAGMIGFLGITVMGPILRSLQVVM